MSEQPTTTFSGIIQGLQCCADVCYGEGEDIHGNSYQSAANKLKPHLARVDAMEKKLDAITTAVAMQMTVLPDDREECSVCGTVDEHTPDCFVATLKYILATPEEPTSTDNVFPQQARYEAMENVMKSLLVDVLLTDAANEDVICSLCSGVNTHFPDCCIGPIEAVLAMPAEATA